MITKILNAMKEYLSCKMGEKVQVVLDTVKKDAGTDAQDIVITLLRIEQETSRKPQAVYVTGKDNKLKLSSPDIEINLEVLISSQATNYESAIKQIAMVISILNSFKTTSKPKGMSDESFSIIQDMSISIMNLSFEQNLSMWQTLGGTLVPSVAYKIRTVTVTGLTDNEENTPVKVVDIVSRHID